jgi:hypothetical protein
MILFIFKIFFFVMRVATAYLPIAFLIAAFSGVTFIITLTRFLGIFFISFRHTWMLTRACRVLLVAKVKQG